MKQILIAAVIVLLASSTALAQWGYAPVVVAPAPTVAYYGPAPVVDYYAPARCRVTYYGPAPVYAYPRAVVVARPRVVVAARLGAGAGDGPSEVFRAGRAGPQCASGRILVRSTE